MAPLKRRSPMKGLELSKFKKPISETNIARLHRAMSKEYSGLSLDFVREMAKKYPHASARDIAHIIGIRSMTSHISSAYKKSPEAGKGKPRGYPPNGLASK